MKADLATVAGFIAFVNAQPADRPINHTYGWSTCAVGDYAREVLKMKTWPWPWRAIRGSTNGWLVACTLFQQTGSISRDTRMGVDHWTKKFVPIKRKATFMDVLNEQHLDNAPTYGTLRAALDEQFPELGFDRPAKVEKTLTIWQSLMERLTGRIQDFKEVGQALHEVI